MANYTIKKVVCSKHFDNETILITDPCYLTFKGTEDKHKFWDAFCTQFFYLPGRGGMIDLPNGVGEIMVSDTLYGDWSCATFEGSLADWEKKGKKVLGEFCADAGLVCVAPESFCDDYLKTSWTTTKIENFTGDVQILVVNMGSGEEDEVVVVGTGSTNFFTYQTGL